MNRATGVAWRWCRAVLLATVAMVAGVVGHVSADGRLPSWSALLVLFLVTAVTAAALLGRPASTFRVVALLAGGQTLIHLALTAMAGHGGVARTTPSPAAAAHDHAAAGHHGASSLHDQLHGDAPVGTHGSVPVPVQHVIDDLTGPNAVMALAHLAAAAAVGLWLAQGERALWTVISLTAAGVREIVHTSLDGFARAVRALRATLRAARLLVSLARIERAGPTPKLLLLARALTRRGPPALLSA